MAFFSKKNKKDEKDINNKSLPKHIAIIMDGNGRWAVNKGLPRAAGHRAGVETLKKIIEFCIEVKIPILTVYAFSTENWKRPQEEINTLMNLMIEYIKKEIGNLNKLGVKVNPIGNITALPDNTYNHILSAVEKTKENNSLILNVALNYGGRAEIVDSVKKIATLLENKEITIADIDEDLIAENLYTKKQPYPDLVIRTSGELRLSNFLLWQLAYSEIWITEVLWPDFNSNHLKEAIYNFQNRNRRYGGLIK